MPCDTTTLDVAPVCLEYTSYTRQLKARLLLLAQALDDIDAGFVLDWDAIRTDAQAAVPCITTGVARAKAAEVVESGLAEADPVVFACDDVLALEQMALFLSCLLVDAINP